MLCGSAAHCICVGFSHRPLHKQSSCLQKALGGPVAARGELAAAVCPLPSAAGFDQFLFLCGGCVQPDLPISSVSQVESSVRPVCGFKGSAPSGRDKPDNGSHFVVV